MYKIIGQDGKEYGPISGEQMRQWISQNRVESRTPVFADGAKDWTFVGLLPEFENLFAGGVPPAIAPQTIAPPVPSRKTNGFATAGLVCGILSLTLCWCCGGFPFNVLGLVFSIIALMQINENSQLHAGRGLAIAGIILAAASFLIFLVLLVSGHSHVIINGGQF
ncbi:MAG TPA: DUF4339 domain-containing protein [Verrucomicrobiae bacterium]|jgi:hypothetical protein|nr:DUF4339 domain-containing protein [Verrucomicrobiae bacterium]